MKASVIGAGSFGTSLAKILSDNNYNVSLWSHSQDTAKVINESRENKIYLPGYTIHENISATTSLEESLRNTNLVLYVVPTQSTREVLKKSTALVPPNIPIVTASKGIEQGSHKLVSEIFCEFFPNDKDRLFFLSGPSFAKEIATEEPTAITIAGYHKDKILKIQEIFNTSYFRVYGTDDVVGVELAGALKNVIAIATGIGDGLGKGNNSKAAIITRGLAEIARLGQAMGAKPITFMGLAGMGDLVLTCSSELSRNRTVGFKLGQGESLDEILRSMRMVAEGVATTQSAYELSKSINVDMPITHGVYQILYENKKPEEVLLRLMSRKLKFEN